MLKKLIKNKWINLKLQEEVATEHKQEVQELQNQIDELKSELEPTKLVNYSTIQTIRFKGTTCMATTTTDTIILDVQHDEHLSILLRRVLKEGLDELESSLEDKKVTFTIPIKNQLILKFLPTTTFMTVDGTKKVRFTLDFTKTINLSSIKNFIEVILGKRPIAETDEILVQVLQSTLKEVSLAYGIELISTDLKDITLTTQSYTKLKIAPKENSKGYSHLNIYLSDFYDGNLTKKVKEYAEEITLKDRQDRVLEKTTEVVNKYMNSTGLGKQAYISLSVIQDNVECSIIIPKLGREPMTLKLTSTIFPISSNELYVNLDEWVNNILTERIKDILYNVYLKYTSPKRIYYTKTFYFSNKGMKYTSGIDGLVEYTIEDIDMIIKYYEIEIFVLKYYGLQVVKNLEFNKDKKTNIELGIIGYDKSKEEIMHLLLEPYVFYKTLGYLTKLPEELEKNVKWCGFNKTFNNNTLTVELYGNPIERVHFIDGYRIEGLNH